MKTLFLTMIFAFNVLLSIGQTSDHLLFKGIPIDGTLDEFVSKMKQKNFKHLGTSNGMAILNGEFAGYSDCHIGVSTLIQTDLVYSVAVIFPVKDTWSKLSSNYFDLKNMLIEKYGQPTDVVEVFESKIQPDDDYRKMHEVNFDRCKYYSTWQTNNGTIRLSINHKGYNDCFVTIAYFDKINGDKTKEKAIDDL